MTDTVENTEATETTEAPKITLEDIASNASDPFVASIWPQLSAVRDAMLETTGKLEKFSPPSQMRIYEWCKSDDADEATKTYLEKIRQLEEATSKLRKEMNDHAKTVLAPDTLPEEELTKLRGEFAKNRDVVKGQLDALGTYAKTMGKQDITDAIGNFTVPRLTLGFGGGSGNAGAAVRNPEAHACREWAKANGMTVSEKGKISAEVWEAYRKANGK